MAVKKLTETGIAKINAPSKGRIDITDSITQGLNLRITSNGVKSWCFAYRYGGKQRRMTLGRYPDISLIKAREIVRNSRADLAVGEDPYKLREDKINANVQKQEDQITVRDMAKEFIELYAIPNTKKWKTTQKFFDNHILPALGNNAVKEVRRKDVIKLLDKIKNSSHPTAANHVLSSLRKMYNWAIERDVLEFNPCSHIKKPVPIKERERVLNKREIKDFWDACNCVGYPYGPICKILLLTGQRCNEIATLKWSYVDEAEKIIRVPAENIKAGRGHDIPITDDVIKILNELPKFRGEYIFTTCHGKKHVAGFGKAKKQFLEKFNPTNDWRFHDLRRTCATNLAELGVPLHTISRVLNHAEGGVTKIYARHSYLKEKRDALNLWASELNKII